MQVRKHPSEEIHPGFETQGRRHQKSKIGVSAVPQKGLMSSKIFYKKREKNLQHIVDFGGLVHDIATEREALKAVVSRKAKDAENEIEKKVDSAIQEAERLKIQI